MSIAIITRVWAQMELEGVELLVMLALADWANDQGECYPSVPGIAAKARITPRGAQIVLRRLEQANFLRVMPGQGMNFGKGPTNRYLILDRTPEHHSGVNTDASTPESLFTQTVSNKPSKDIEEAEAIYQAYPRHIGKPAALAKIRLALKKISALDLLTKTRAYAEAVKVAGKDPNFIPHPATWFYQERFNDDPSTWVGSSGARKNGVAKPKPAADYVNHGFTHQE